MGQRDFKQTLKRLNAALKNLLNKKHVCKGIPQPMVVKFVRNIEGKGNQEKQEPEQLWLYIQTARNSPLPPFCPVLCNLLEIPLEILL